jgi:hypothetical protein
VEMLVAMVGFVLTLVGLIVISTFVQRSLTGRGEVSSLDRRQRRHRRNSKTLWGLILVAIAYSGLLGFLQTLTGIAMLDGSIGVAIGLYICAHPAANAVNILFFERDALRHISEWSVVRWLGLNLLVLLAGWMVIFIGLRRLFYTAG